MYEVKWRKLLILHLAPPSSQFNIWILLINTCQIWLNHSNKLLKLA
jgi:hypothetical protein